MDSTADRERKTQVRKRERQNEEVSPRHQEAHRQDTRKTWRNARKEKWYSLLHHRNKETLNDVAKKEFIKKLQLILSFTAVSPNADSEK